MPCWADSVQEIFNNGCSCRELPEENSWALSSGDKRLMATHRGNCVGPPAEVPGWSLLTSQFQVPVVLTPQQMKCLQMWSLEMDQPGPGVGTHRTSTPSSPLSTGPSSPASHLSTCPSLLWSPCPGPRRVWTEGLGLHQALVRIESVSTRKLCNSVTCWLLEELVTVSRHSFRWAFLKCLFIFNLSLFPAEIF